MKISRAALLALFVLALLLAACQEAAPTETNPNAATTPDALAGVPVGGTSAAQETPFATSQTPPPPPVAQAQYCKNGGAVTVTPNEPLAAKVNGQPVPLAVYQRQVAQEQSALVAQGLDPKSKNGQEELKGLGPQVLGQLIDDALVEQAARQENISVSEQDVNNRIQQMIDDAGGRDKFDNYLKSTQLQLDDLCTQIRSSIFGEIMLTRVTAALPTKVEQVHVSRILLANQAEANQVLAQLKAGKDFAALAKQYSKDESTRDNGGDLGWLPKGILPPEIEAVAFQLKPGQVSGIIQDQLGFDIVKVLERDSARDLSPELLQYQRQQAFLAWLDAQRNKAKIEKLANP
jgi:parvulin-like peptidyl-prolyl isomerase